MGHFYFTRHGQTVWNVENKICGATDIELTELGHEQATVSYTHLDVYKRQWRGTEKSSGGVGSGRDPVSPSVSPYSDCKRAVS